MPSLSSCQVFRGFPQLSIRFGYIHCHPHSDVQGKVVWLFCFSEWIGDAPGGPPALLAEVKGSAEDLHQKEESFVALAQKWQQNTRKGEINPFESAVVSRRARWVVLFAWGRNQII